MTAGRRFGWTRPLLRRFDASSIDISIDRSALRIPSLKKPLNPNKSSLTPLAQFLQTLIEMRGPLNVNEYMTQCLTHHEFGYYMNKDVFGTKGDFTTAPEISQMFGELIGIWCVATWQQMGMPDALNIVELGPGRGTLQADLLSAAKMFPEFYKSLHIHLVDVSPVMKALQQQTLQCQTVDEKTMRVPEGPLVTWHSDVASVPKAPALYIAQEFFDALPLHQFEYTSKGWCERLIDLDVDDGPDHFRYVLSNGATPAVRAYLTNQKIFDASGVYELHDLQNPKATVTMEEATEGDRIEFSPASIAVVTDLAKRISEHSGAALIVDYGRDGISGNTLRGIRDHEFVSPLNEPGKTDLSVDVDFSSLRRFASKIPGVNAYGAISQGDFLLEMGIEHRLASLLESCDNDSTREMLFESYQRLIEPDQMGNIFKTIAIASETQDIPVGFKK